VPPPGCCAGAAECGALAGLLGAAACGAAAGADFLLFWADRLLVITMRANDRVNNCDNFGTTLFTWLFDFINTPVRYEAISAYESYSR
jgi:hypothetical protein